MVKWALHLDVVEDCIVQELTDKIPSPVGVHEIVYTYTNIMYNNTNT